MVTLKKTYLFKKDTIANVVYRQKLIFVPGKRLKNMMKQSGVTCMVFDSENISDGTRGNTGGSSNGDENENPLG